MHILLQETVKPFGRAVYQGQASYPVIPHWCMPIVHMCAEAAVTAAHLSPTLALVQVSK